MIIGFNKPILDVAHDRKSSRKMWSLIRAANELMWGPVHFYIFDLAFIQSDHRKEVYTAMVKNGKDIIAQKEEGRERERQRKKKKHFQEWVLSEQAKGIVSWQLGESGGQIGPLVPIHKRGNSWGRHQSSALLSPATHTHTYP